MDTRFNYTLLLCTYDSTLLIDSLTSPVCFLTAATNVLRYFNKLLVVVVPSPSRWQMTRANANKEKQSETNTQSGQGKQKEKKKKEGRSILVSYKVHHCCSSCSNVTCLLQQYTASPGQWRYTAALVQQRNAASIEEEAKPPTYQKATFSQRLHWFLCQKSLSILISF